MKIGFHCHTRHFHDHDPDPEAMIARPFQLSLHHGTFFSHCLNVS
ncbi:MAG: hypothetical protein WA151_18665 [Desulfatirhabdiaceae bacterium]